MATWENYQPPSTLSVSLAPGLGAGGTLTLTAPAAGFFIYVTSFDFTVAGSATAQTAGAAVFITTTGLPNTPSWAIAVGNAIGGIQSLSKNWVSPLKASAAGAAVTFVAPVPGNQSTIRMNVSYFIAP